ncbi:hypothetical protein M438DRAFT_274746 [Aureobasidium pullulans EXF-150]|uniref:Uncharacterized protein n=1 Tax=Aureobasidium pullulans EXF-150 TaxID=1043002 RepID=A0A074YBH7_AURPU|nr:uncharacterized protein M438DRAFT_274746 [Aureobasidium pullulans EXF-150]KEQ84191.1 hypothetical protein M438DRAFT_274746 [Aureobasidium pullulans EXF-150]
MLNVCFRTVSPSPETRRNVISRIHNTSRLTQGERLPQNPRIQQINHQHTRYEQRCVLCGRRANEKKKREGYQGDKTRFKTYSSRDSHVVTHRSTNLPFNCLCMAERTGCPVFS